MASSLFSLAAAARILGVAASQIVRFEVWCHVCFVIVKGKRPTFISKKAFCLEFVGFRQRQGRSIAAAGQVIKSSNGYRVTSSSPKAAPYRVSLSDRSVDCNCPDYAKQQQAWGRGACKHGYAVLNTLGLSTLSEYVERQAIAA